MLIDPRDNDVLDKDKYHAVILTVGELSILRRWLNEVSYVQEFKGA